MPKKHRNAVEPWLPPGAVRPGYRKVHVCVMYENRGMRGNVPDGLKKLLRDCVEQSKAKSA